MDFVKLVNFSPGSNVASLAGMNNKWSIVRRLLEPLLYVGAES
jgi:hypothetical protein